MKRLKNVEEKNEEQLNAIKHETYLKSYFDLFDENLTPEALELIKEIKSVENYVDYDKLSFTDFSKNFYGFVSFKIFVKLIKELYNEDMIIDKAEAKQNEFAENLLS